MKAVSHFTLLRILALSCTVAVFGCRNQQTETTQPTTGQTDQQPADAANDPSTANLAPVADTTIASNSSAPSSSKLF